MNYLVDTCGWIEWLSSGSLKDQFERYLAVGNHLIVPALVQLELFKWVSREKSKEAAFSVIGVTAQCQVVPVDTSIALSAAEISLTHKLAMADSIIYATAQCHNAIVVTSDAHFKKLERVIFFDKS